MLVDSTAILYVYGEESDSVIFTTPSDLDKWKGLKFYKAHSTSIIEYAIVERSDSSGIDVYYSNITIRNCYIRGNNNRLNEGGGVQCEGSGVYITNNIFKNNSSQFSGGLYCFAGNIFVTHNLFWENESPDGGSGGGVFLEDIDTSGTFSYNIVWDNTTTFDGLKGGGIALSGSNLKIFNNIFYDNFANFKGGGIMLSWESHPDMRNNIFWNNDAGEMEPEIGWDDYSQPDTNINYCDIQDTLWPGEGNISADPLFIDPSDPVCDFHLRWDDVPDTSETMSPCIDAGDTTFQKDPDSTWADIGAFYFHHVTICNPYVPGDVNGDGNVMGNDVTYGVRYFKGLGFPPPDSCQLPDENWLYVAGDANGNCSFTGSDITFLVAYFKGSNPEILWCPDTPPSEPPLQLRKNKTTAPIPKE